nr:lysozyme [Rickettsia endosymbiont of Ceutorhynchus assimilis]
MGTRKLAKELIKQFEGLSLTAYRCPAGLRTIGYGHVIKRHEQTKIGDRITQEQAEGLLEEDVKQAQRILYKYCSVYLSIPQKAALISFIFNCGSGKFQASTLRQKLNREEYYEAANQLLRWVHDSKGVRLRGLVKRRALERSVFLEEVNAYLPNNVISFARNTNSLPLHSAHNTPLLNIIASAIKGFFKKFKPA